MPMIVFEGTEGAGKTTLALLTKRWLEEQGKSVILTREPGSTHNVVTKMLRELILNPPEKLSPLTELFLYIADRAQHIDNVVKPALSTGTYVVCDRYMLSTYVYQGYMKGLSLDYLDELHKVFPVPDITFVLDVNPGIAWTRVQSRAKETGVLNRFDASSMADYSDMVAYYKLLVRTKSIEQTGLIQVLNANHKPHQILPQLKRLLALSDDTLTI